MNGVNRKMSTNDGLLNDKCYKALKVIAELMDKRYLDPLIGFLLPALGDLSVLLLNLPYLYFSLFRVKSVPLSIAIVYNALLDCLIGLIPFGIGDFLDIFHRSYVKNYRLIVGYVEEDKSVKNAVRRKYVYMAIAIVLLLLAIGWMVKWLLSLINGLAEMVSGAFA